MINQVIIDLKTYDSLKLQSEKFFKMWFVLKDHIKEMGEETCNEFYNNPDDLLKTILEGKK